MKKISFYKYRLPFFALLLSILLISIFYVSFYDKAEKNFNEKLKIQTDNIKDKIEDYVNGRVLALVRMSDRISASGHINKSELFYNAELYIKHNLGYHAIEWVDKDLVLRWSVPSKYNELPLNTEITNNLVYKKTAFLSLNSKQPEFTPIINFSDGKKYISVYVPIYIKNDFKGFIVGVFKIESILKNVLKKETDKDFYVLLSENGKHIYFTGNNLNYNDYRYDDNLDFYNTHLNLSLIKTKRFFYEQESETLNIIIYAGFFLSLSHFLIALFLQSIYNQKKQLDEVKNELQEKIENQAKTEAKLKESQEHYKLITENMSDLICLYDIKCRYTYISPSVFDLLGFLPDELIGKYPFDLFHPDDLNNINEKSYSKIVNGLCGEFTEHRIKTKDGNYKWFETINKPVFDSDGNIASYESSSRNITERKKYEEEVLKIKEQLEMVIKATNDGYWDWNFETNEIYFSPRWKEMLGYQDDELPNDITTWDKVIFPEDKIKAMKLTDDYNNGIINNFRQEQRFYHKNGAIIYILSKAIHIKDKNGKVIRMVGAHKDITDNVKSAQELLLAKEQADSANKLKSDFLAMMSHEIRTPMNGVIGMTDLLSSTELSDEQADFVNTIKLSGEILLAIINDILDFSKIESGKLELENSTFELRSCIEDVFDLLSTKATEKNIELLYSINLDVPDFISSDILRIRQILINILNNAIKFTDEGEIKIFVEKISQNNSQITLKFLIKDTGIGIPKNKIKSLFNPFIQVDSSTTRKYGGTGLGLAICKRIINLMKGDIWIESSENITEHGTSVFFTIDAEIVDNTSKLYLKKNVPLFLNKKILISSENKSLLATLKKQTEEWGINTDTINSKNDFLFTENDYDVVLVDITTKNIDFIEKIRQMNSSSHKKFIAISFPEQAKEFETGDLFLDYINKPIRQLNLFKSLMKIFGENLQKEENSIISSKKISECNSNLSILLAEDNKVNQKITLKMLSKLGYTADIANNGFEAIQLLKDKYYDLIFMDIQMPEMNGYEATKYIRSNFDFKTKIIALTANAMADDKQKCIDAGMDDYLSKPIVMDNLRNSIIKNV